MGQSNAIFAALLLAFIVFITARGELPAYLQILRGGGQKAAQQSGGDNASGNTSQGGTSVINSISDFLGGQSVLSLTPNAVNPSSTPLLGP